MRRLTGSHQSVKHVLRAVSSGRARLQDDWVAGDSRRHDAPIPRALFVAAESPTCYVPGDGHHDLRALLSDLNVELRPGRGADVTNHHALQFLPPFNSSMAALSATEASALPSSPRAVDAPTGELQRVVPSGSHRSKSGQSPRGWGIGPPEPAH